MYKPSAINGLNSKLFKLARDLSFKLGAHAVSTRVNIDGTAEVSIYNADKEIIFWAEAGYSTVTRTLKARINRKLQGI